ncbi:MAG: hypothetical protein LBL74_03785 [Bacteroidales bacterium]|jgi:hypothetical protein|nr:hypothetical protein [Bacteroidales bacterium]
MKKLLLILCILGSVALFSCGDAMDCTCNLTQSVPELQYNSQQTYSILAYEGECSSITAETFNYSGEVASYNTKYPIQYSLTCQEK